ncbi:MAG: DUF3185 family protein [Desulfuromonadales bacterium]|nr:DUF3185 family protein [Desulfuromonadales bacterium]
MAKKSNMSIAGIVLLVAGIGLIFWGYQMSGSALSQVSKGLSGSLPDAVMYRYIGGAICAAVGGFLLFKK